METVIRTKVKDLLKSEPGREVLAKGWVRKIGRASCRERVCLYV